MTDLNPASKPVPMVFVNEMRLTARQWLAAVGLVALVGWLTPVVWKRLERMDAGPDYRVPYALSKDYWLYERRLEALEAGRIGILGDSVVWGEYVRPSGTLSHFLNEGMGGGAGFANIGVNGMFPLALEGLVRHYGGSLRGRKVILHCNVLWLTSPKADLQTTKEERFNHADLVPQFFPRIPCYRADAGRRLSVVVEREVPLLKWVNHIQSAYFGQKSVLNWTLEDDGGTPPRLVNARRNPLAQVTLRVPVEPPEDPERGEGSGRHKAWSKTGEGSTRFDWVGLETSLQWAAFQRLVGLLKARGNDVMVVVGPFNEHIMAAENRAASRRVRDGIVRWLGNAGVAHVAPETLPSVLYADASHPLTAGYRELAGRLLRDPVFQEWVKRGR